MDRILVKGGQRLEGEVAISGSKNAALPLLISSLLTEDLCTYEGIPDLKDIYTTLKLLSGLGVKRFEDPVSPEVGKLSLRADKIETLEAPYDLVKTMRASFLVLGPLLTRFGQARVSTPGGCAIGSRPVNLHLKGLALMGAEIESAHGYVEVKAKKLNGAKIHLDIPSVGATENLMMAATLAKGTTVIINAAREPEVVELATMLNQMGAGIHGVGGDTLVIEGRHSLSGVTYPLIADRIEAGTFIVAAAITGGDVHVRGARVDHLENFLREMAKVGVDCIAEERGIRVKGTSNLKCVDIMTLPYPGFPTDLQAQMMVLMAVADGVSVITETIFENRFMHVQELNRMGASIRIEGNRAIIKGVKKLSGAPVMATDLRASVSLILAGLVGSGKTEISRVYHLDRGYEHIEEKFSRLGAKIQRVR